ncbi:hypothetical protein ACWPKO_13785 [Coraliomargarita sp. W4R53]
MSDAQSILLILLFFYFIECLKWAPLGSISLTSVAFSKSRWQVQMATVNFFGMRKSLFVAPIFPALQGQIITDKVGDGGHQHSSVKTATGVRRRLFRLRVRTLTLRIISVSVFATYFLLLPALYLKFGLGSYVYTAVGIAYLLQASCAICYYLVHRRFFPQERGLRMLHTFYNLALPWHAMRAVDEFFIKSSCNWSELALLGGTYVEGDPHARLAFYWRESQLLQKSNYSERVLVPILEEVGLTPRQAMQATVPHERGQTYCACCGAIYREDVLQCMDCRGLNLSQS